MENQMPVEVLVRSQVNKCGFLVALLNSGVWVEFGDNSWKVFTFGDVVIARTGPKEALLHWCWQCGVWEEGLEPGNLCQPCQQLDIQKAELQNVPQRLAKERT